MKDFWTSIAAFEDCFGKDCRGGCIRRGCFRKIFKLPERQRAATVLGDVAHAVVGRFFSADDRGLYNGQPVDLYPPGWQTMVPRFNQDAPPLRITATEESLIKILIDKAIEDGVLCRVPGRIIERPIDRPIFTEKSGAAPIKIVLKGFIDLETPRSVEDHKFVKSLEYAVSVKTLDQNVQLMVYAWDKFERGHREDSVWVAHNNFVKDFSNPQVVRREAEVSREHVYEYFNGDILPRFQVMFENYKHYLIGDVDKWKELPGPNDTKECNYHFGGKCPFLGICTETISVGAYKAKFGQVVVSDVAPNAEAANQERKDNIMDLLERIRQGNQKVVGDPTPPPPAAPPTPPATPPTAMAGILANVQKFKDAATAQATAGAAPVTPPPSTQQAAPWYMQGCVACKDNDILGFDSRGNPCAVCDALAGVAEKPRSTDFTYTVSDAGVITYTAKGQAAPTTPASPVTPPAEVTPVQRKPRTKTQTKVPTIAPAVTPVIESVPAPKPELDGYGMTPEDWEAVHNGTLKMPGFTLLIGCTIVKNDNRGDTIMVDDLLKLALDTIGTTADHFAQMTKLDAYIPSAVGMLAGATVVSFAPTKGTTLARLVDGLRPYASTVIAALG